MLRILHNLEEEFKFPKSKRKTIGGEKAVFEY